MARFNPIKNSFVSGELSPRLEGRDDLDQYFQGMRQALNGIVLPHGGFMHRSGTRFVKEIKDSSIQARLIPFQVSVQQAYVVEVGVDSGSGGYMRFYANEGRIESGGAVEVSTPYTSSDDLRDLQFAQEADVMYVVHVSHPTYKLSRDSLTAFSFDRVTWTDGKAPLRALNATSTTITVTGSGPYTLTASAALFDSGTSDDGRAVRVNDGSNEGWFKISSTSSDTVATATLESGTAPTGAQTDWSLGMESDEEGFRAVAFHEGRLAFGGANDQGSVVDRLALSNSDDFEQFGNDPTNADHAIYRRMTSTPGAQGQVNAIQWLVSTDEALFIGTTGGEFRLVGENEDLLTPEGARVRPGTNRGSAHIMPIVIGGDINFVQRNTRKLRQITFDVVSDKRIAKDISILAEHILDSGGAKEIAYQQDPDSVAWIVRGDGILVGFTIEPEQDVVGAHRHRLGGSLNTGIAEVESVAVIEAPDGSEDQLWMIVKRTVDGSTVRYVEFMEDQFRPLITPRSTQDERINALKEAWFLDSALELNAPIDITGITQADPGVVTTDGAHGLDDGDQVYVDGVVGMTGVNDVAYLVANKTSTTFELTDLDGNDVDTSGFSAYVSGGEVRLMTDTVTGLDHLEGETVGILTDGGTHADETVSSGSVTLDRKSARVVVGLKRPYRGETQRFIGGGQIGTDQGQSANIQRVNLRVQDTLGLRVATGSDPADTEPLVEREGSWPMNRAAPIQSGDFEVPVDDEWDQDPTVYFEQTDPLPATVLAIMPRMESGEG